MYSKIDNIQWVIDPATGIVTGQQLLTGGMVVPWPSSIGNITNGILIDPRNYGAKCTGCYGIAANNIFASDSGLNFAVGDVFLVADQTLGGRVRGGVLAQGHVTQVGTSGQVITYTLDTPGSGYFTSALWVQPLTGIGNHFAIQIASVNTPPSIPNTSLAFGGNSTGTQAIGSYNYGGAYQVGDLFAVPNPSKNLNYMTGRVSGVNSLGQVTSYVINNPGGDYVIMSNVPTIRLTGYGSGLLINVNQATSSNGTWDDTYGFIAAANAAVAAGGAVLVPNNSWVSNLMLPSGATLMGEGWGPNYAYGDVPDNIYPSTNPHMFIIGTPSFGIDYNGQADLAFVGFEVRGYTGASFGSGTTWDSTAAIGSFVGAGSAFGGSKVWHYQMSCKGCCTGWGSYNGTGSYIFGISQNSDYGANANGIWGPFSDFLTYGDTIASTNNGIILPTSAGGLNRIMFPRIEYAQVGLTLSSGGVQTEVIGAQFDRMGYIAVLCNGVNGVNFTGGSMKGSGLAGTWTVTGAANNGSGAIRLTVTGFGHTTTGGGTPTGGIVTGQIANVTGVVGTTEANANQWVLTIVDGTHVDLQGSTFTNAYVSGGVVNVNGAGSYVVIENSSTDIHFANVGFYGYSAGAQLPAASIVDIDTTCSRISFHGGTANFLATGFTSGYLQAFGNYHNSGNTPPAGFSINVTGYNEAATPTPVNGSVSGMAIFSQPIQGSDSKEVLIYCAALSGTAAYTFPMPFTNVPAILTTNGLSAAIVTTLSATGCIVTGAPSTGNIILKGF